MRFSNRLRIKVAGESGQGINSIGEMLAKIAKRSGFPVFANREYPSLIKGGFASYQVDISDRPIYSGSKNCDLLVCISRVSVYEYLQDIDDNGFLLHTLPQLEFSDQQKQLIRQKKIIVEYFNADELALLNGGSKIMSNTIVLGLIVKLVDLKLDIAEQLINEQFKHKPDVIPANLACLKAGFEIETPLLSQVDDEIKLNYKPIEAWGDSLLIDGNSAIGLGAVSAGVRAYYAYPMTPSSSILDFLSTTYKESGILIKQAEDEITAVQMTLGSMFMGARALTGTSGGGFDLMTETLSLAGMTETPLVCILAQRPGPATGLPTWTMAADLNLAVYSGHGEFPRVVIAVSDPISAYERVQEAFNFAEKYQVPVIVMTEKQIAESFYNFMKLPLAMPIERGLTTLSDIESVDQVSEEEGSHSLGKSRYENAQNGISPRWLPGSSNNVYLANSDEHNERGDSIEDARNTRQQIEKRMTKIHEIVSALPEPKLFGPERAKMTFVGWGSTKNVMLDLIEVFRGSKYENLVNYLHFEYLYPLNREHLMKFLPKDPASSVLIENNYMGQFGNLIQSEVGYHFGARFLKYNGRAFNLEDLLEFLKVKI